MSATVPLHSQSGTTGSTSPAPGVAERPGRRVHSYQRGDVVVLEARGQLDRAGVEDVRRAALALTGRAVVIDLSDCVLTHPRALMGLADDGGDPVELCFVSRRSTCRLLLARSGITSQFAVFNHVKDALQARRFATAGYGQGWRRPS